MTRKYFAAHSESVMSGHDRDPIDAAADNVALQADQHMQTKETSAGHLQRHE